VFLTLAFGRGAPAKVSVVGLMQIVFVLAFSVWLFERPVDAITLVGTALVIAPTAWLLTRPTATSETQLMVDVGVGESGEHIVISRGDSRKAGEPSADGSPTPSRQAGTPVTRSPAARG
jgi:hypothetical protein